MTEEPQTRGPGADARSGQWKHGRKNSNPNKLRTRINVHKSENDLRCKIRENNSSGPVCVYVCVCVCVYVCVW